MHHKTKERGMWDDRLPRPCRRPRRREPLPIHLTGPRPWRGPRRTQRRLDLTALVVLVAVYAIVVILAMWAYAPPPGPTPRELIPVNELPHDPRPEPPLEGGGR